MSAPPSTLPRADARQAFQRLMQTKSARIDMLRRLLKANGIENLDSGDASVQDLNDWFLANVEPDPQRPGSLLPDWYSVVNDVALFLGDVMIERHPNLHWEFFTWGKKNASYQRPVIMGFGTEDPKFRTNLDVHRGVATYGHRIVAQRGSIPTYGTVTVRGAKLDIDATTEASHLREVDIDEFRRSLQIAARRA